MTGPLRPLLERAEHPHPVVTAPTAGRWPRGAADRLEALGVLAPLPPAEAVGCDSCGADHVEPVAWTDTPGGPPRAFLWCPADGRVPVHPDRLKRWAVRPAALGRAVAGCEPTERLPDRVWKLGPVRAGDVFRVGWLVAGWRGEAGLADRVPELVQPTAVVFVPADLPPAAVWGTTAPPTTIPLADVLTLTATWLGVNPSALAAHLPPVDTPAAPPDGLTAPAGYTFIYRENRLRLRWVEDGQVRTASTDWGMACGPPPAGCDWLPAGWPCDWWPLGTTPAHLGRWAEFASGMLSAGREGVIPADDRRHGWRTLLRATRLLAAHLNVPGAPPPAAPLPLTRDAARGEVLALCDGLAHADSGKSDPPVGPPADEPVGVTAPRVHLPPGTRWEDVGLHLDGDTIRVQTDDTTAVLTFAQAGFADRRAGPADPPRPNRAWQWLARLARRRGVLGTGDRIDTKPGALRRVVSDIGRRLQTLTGLTDPPFKSGRGKAYRAKFTATATGAVHPPPVGATWDHLTLTELSEAEVEVTFDAAEVTVVGGQAATAAAEQSARYEWADLALPPPVESALRGLLRGQKPAAGDPAATALEASLVRFLPVDGRPFEERNGRWLPRFDARSAARDPAV